MKIIIKKAANNELFFIIVARNGRTLCTSETYKRQAGCMKAIKAIKKGIADCEVVPFSISSD